MVEVNIGKEVRNINELEKVVYERMRETGKELMVEVLRRTEKEAMRKVKGVKIGFGEMRMHSYESYGLKGRRN